MTTRAEAACATQQAYACGHLGGLGRDEQCPWQVILSVGQCLAAILAHFRVSEPGLF